MKITFPHMGSPLIYTKLFELLGHEVIVPPKPTQKTINLGVKYSPEFACFPLKVLLGTYLEAIEMGADTIVSSGGNGPCRAGYYGEVHQRLIRNMGLDIDFIIFDELKRDYKGFINKLKKLKGQHSWFDLYEIVKTAYKMAVSTDKVKKFIEHKRPYISDKKKLNKVKLAIEDQYREIKTEEDIVRVEEYAFKILKGLDIEEKTGAEKLKIGIVGEIYVVMEAGINFNLAELLNDFGVEVEMSHYISEWIQENLIPFVSHEKEIMKKAEDYIETIIGGHAKQNVGHIVDYKERGFDGIVHLKPFGCLPELVTQSILDKLSEDLDLPILSLSIDEQMATANVMTRIEAFIDMIKQKKYKRSSDHERHVFGY
ncbi:MAG: hypothetical protein FH762_00070 [Firmicutes bacterium]|nr:hypothetical protein [Bacillota bacterium]